MTSQTLVFSMEAQSLERIEQKFQEKLNFADTRKDKLFHVFQQPLTEEEAWALKYVYAYMPVNDLADYDGELFLSHVRRALDIRKRVPWGNAYQIICFCILCSPIESIQRILKISVALSLTSWPTGQRNYPWRMPFWRPITGVMKKRLILAAICERYRR